MGDMQRIREAYKVPARRGGRIRYTGGIDPQEGTIIGPRTLLAGIYIRVKFDNDPSIQTIHPTWEVEYLPDPDPVDDHETPD